MISYTKGGKNEIFGARPAPIHISAMGFAGTMGSGNIAASSDGSPDPLGITRRGDSGYFDSMDSRFIDYAIVDEIACPTKLICGQEFDEAYVNAENAASVEFTHLNGQSGDICADNDSNRIYTVSNSAFLIRFRSD
jgi:hypothetical protein